MRLFHPTPRAGDWVCCRLTWKLSPPIFCDDDGGAYACDGPTCDAKIDGCSRPRKNSGVGFQLSTSVMIRLTNDIHVNRLAQFLPCFENDWLTSWLGNYQRGQRTRTCLEPGLGSQRKLTQPGDLKRRKYPRAT